MKVIPMPKRGKRAKKARAASAPGRRKRKNPSARDRRLQLSSVEGVRKTLGRFVREYDRDRLSESKLRAQVYALRGVLAALELEQQIALLPRFLELEARVDSLVKERTA